MGAGVSHAQALSTGCGNLNTMGFLVTPPNGFSGNPAENLTAQISTGAFTAGERVTVSVNTVATDGISTLTVQNNANTITLLAIVLSDGASVTATVPAGFSGIDFVSDANDAGPVTNLVFQCAAAVAEAAPSAGPGSAVVSNAVARTQTALNNQNLQRHLEAVTGGAVALDPSRVDPTPDALDPPSAGGFAPGVSFGETIMPGLKRGVGGRAALRQLSQMISLDSAMPLTFQEAQAPPGRGPPGADGTGTRVEQSRLRPNSNVWAYSSFSVIENDRNRVGDDQRFDGDVITVTAGADHWITGSFLAGAAVSYSSTDLDTAFNTGEYREDGYTVSPYFLYRFRDWLSVNGSLGYTLGTIDQTRNAGAVSSEAQADTAHATATLRARHRFGVLPLGLVGRAGILYAHRRVESFVESDGTVRQPTTTETGELHAGAEVNYTIRVAPVDILPFVSTDWLHETMDATNGDRDAFDIAAGIRWGVPEAGFSGSIEATAILGRDDYDQYGGRGILVYSFDLPRGLGTVQPSLNTELSGSASLGSGLTYLHPSRALRLALDVTATAGDDRLSAFDSYRALLRLDLKF